jgi:hypothetical protein
MLDSTECCGTSSLYPKLTLARLARGVELHDVASLQLQRLASVQKLRSSSLSDDAHRIKRCPRDLQRSPAVSSHLQLCLAPADAIISVKDAKVELKACGLDHTVFADDNRDGNRYIAADARVPQLSKRAARTIGASLCAKASATGQSLVLSQPVRQYIT